MPQLYVDVDRDRAKLLGVDIDALFNTVAATLGTFYVNDFNKFGRTWQVLMSADPAYRVRPEDIGALYVPAQDGTHGTARGTRQCRVHLGSGNAGSLQQPAGGEDLWQFGARHQFRPGTGNRRAIADRTLSEDFSYDWSSASFQEKRSSGTSGLALGLAVLMVFLILAAQYEKWSLPIAVQLALPFGTFGALAAVWLRGLNNDVYFQIGLVTLLGLAAKNAILIVEYAVLKKSEGYSASAAAMEAARLRFRPILMTSLAFILGVMPLAISTGAGAGARHAVGTGVAGRHAGGNLPGDLLHPAVLPAGDRPSPGDRPGRFRADAAPAAAHVAAHTQSSPGGAAMSQVLPRQSPPDTEAGSSWLNPYLRDQLFFEDDYRDTEPGLITLTRTTMITISSIQNTHMPNPMSNPHPTSVPGMIHLPDVVRYVPCAGAMNWRSRIPN